MQKILIIAVMLLVAICACNKEIKKNTPSSYLTVTVKDSLPADKRVNSEVLLKVDVDIASSQSAVTFKIGPIGEFSDGTTTLTTTVDVNGEARAYIRSDKPGLTYIETTVGSYTQRTPVTFVTSFSPADYIALQITHDSVDADNNSYDIITASSMDSSTTIRQSITFTTDKGVFQNGSTTYTAQTGVDGTVRAYLRSATLEVAHVVATVESIYTEDVYMHFMPAYPDNITVDMPGTLANSLSAKLSVTAHLSRVSGMPSAGLIVHYKAMRGLSDSVIGAFFNITPSTVNGTNVTSTADFWIQDTTYKGYVYIKAYVAPPPPRDSIAGIAPVLITK